MPSYEQALQGLTNDAQDYFASEFLLTICITYCLVLYYIGRS